MTALDGNEPFWLFLGVVAIMAAFAILRRARRRSRPGAPRWGRDGDVAPPRHADKKVQPGFSGNDSSRGPGGTDGGASDNDGAGSGGH